MTTLYRRKNFDAKAKAEVREQAEKAFRRLCKIKPMTAIMGELEIQQKLDRKTGAPIPGMWVVPGGREITTSQLYALSKSRGAILIFRSN